jgi:ribulose 1,5-bisphosphate synthetase/thiazole synthase
MNQTANSELINDTLIDALRDLTDFDVILVGGGEAMHTGY